MKIEKVNITRLIENIKQTNVYTPVIEAIVNSIESIEEAGRKDGEIDVVLYRDDQKIFDLGEEVLPVIRDIEISDNGVGFTEENFESFKTLYSDYKILKGGKGFGRFAFLKYFSEAKIVSIFSEDGKSFSREFTFPTVADDGVAEKKEVVGGLLTTIKLQGLKRNYDGKMNKKVETVARKILEKILVFFVLENYNCPRICISEGGEKIVLNDYIETHNEIVKIGEKDFVLEKNDQGSVVQEKFHAKVFKVYYDLGRSEVCLAANNRQVTDEALYKYIPEFKDNFFDIVDGEDGKKINKNYSIRVYVQGEYLDKHVSLERGGFEFQNSNDLFFLFGQEEIERKAVDIIKESFFKEEVLTRQKKKEIKVQEYVDKKACWHKPYFKELDLSMIPYNVSETDLEGELNKIKFNKEVSAKNEIRRIVESDKIEQSDKIDELLANLTTIGKSDLVHYVVSRSVVLDFFKKSLEWNKQGKYEIEKAVHEIIFPTKTDSDSLSYDQHNLWIIDERLSFHEYLASDKPLTTNDDRPDILIFDNRISVRGGEESANPIVVFEFKRPQREDYADDEDPIKQICRYVEKIRDGKFKTPLGRVVKANENTPAYGYLICDLTDKIRNFCSKDNSLAPSPDNEGYFGYLPGYKVYIEVISFDKLVKDSELRNKVFFRKLGLI